MRPPQVIAEIMQESTNDPLGTNEFDLIKEEKMPIWFWMNIRVGENEIDHGSIKIGRGKTFEDPGIDVSVSGTHAIKTISIFKWTRPSSIYSQFVYKFNRGNSKWTTASRK